MAKSLNEVVYSLKYIDKNLYSIPYLNIKMKCWLEAVNATPVHRLQLWSKANEAIPDSQRGPRSWWKALAIPAPRALKSDWSKANEAIPVMRAKLWWKATVLAASASRAKLLVSSLICVSSLPSLSAGPGLSKSERTKQTTVYLKPARH